MKKKLCKLIAAISKLYIAGGFGSYLNIANAAKIGLLPKDLAENAKVVGNAALSGASMLLLGAEPLNGIEATELELSSNPVFSDLYMTGMVFE